MKTKDFLLKPAAVLLLTLFFASITAAQSKVVIPGTFQSELGCGYPGAPVGGDWEPDCNYTALTYNAGTGMWTGTFTIPAGCHLYKVAINGSWSENYGEFGIPGGANISLYVPEESPVTFTYNPWSHLVETSPYPSGFSPECLPTVVLTGSFQSEAGCSNDWDPLCTNTALTFNSGSGLFEGDFLVPAGCYDYRVVLNGDWWNSFGQYGQINGPNYLLSVPAQATMVHFTYDPYSHIVQCAYNTWMCLPSKVVLAGNFQDELGCTNDWSPDCQFSELTFNPQTGNYEADLYIPQGCWEYRVVLNGNWATNYGQWGDPNGPNYILSLPEKADVVHFSFNPYGNWVYSSYNSMICQPGTVVIAGSFQQEVGCTGDWMADCNNSRMSFYGPSGNWLDTLFIPAGSWEFKITINNSWDENYGDGGILNGANIPLELCYPAQVVFHYNHQYHWVYTEIITNGICLKKFYDANVNNYFDPGELPMAGISFTLTGQGISRTATTDESGKAAFGDLPNGEYLIRENVPAGYYTTVQDSQYVYLYNGQQQVFFGNVCLGAGGAQSMGYWIGKNGETALNKAGKMQEALMQLRYLYLRNADGGEFDPYNYNQLRTWLKGANAKNMSYMVSAQMATLYLNNLMGYTQGDFSYIYTGSCGFPYGKFMSGGTLVWVTNYFLMYNANVTAKDPNRSLMECIKNILDKANNNLNFVQPGPCGKQMLTMMKPAIKEPEIVNENIPQVWPNPSSYSFILRPANRMREEMINLRVFDLNGRTVYGATGSNQKDYRFGEQFTGGIYMAEVTQGGKRTTIKLVKQ